MSEAVITLKKGEGRTIKAGGAWIFDNEIESIAGGFENGDVVVVHDFDGYKMGRGFINMNSKIRVRMLTRLPEQSVNEDFIRVRVNNAWSYRKSVMFGGNGDEVPGGDLNCVRVIFGEADYLPGLVVDKYDDVLVVESLALGIDRLKPVILKNLLEILNDDGIVISAVYERSDAPVRKKEGMVPFKGIIPLELIKSAALGEDGKVTFGNGAAVADDFAPEATEEERVNKPVEIVENGVHYMVDVINGQKTGFFLDQKYNRLAMQRIIKGMINNQGANTDVKTANDLRVLDCFTHMGTFAINCGLAGAGDVTGLDISEYAVLQATENAERNNLADRVKFRAANVLDELPRLYDRGEKYDIVILDPPAFTKSREATKNAMKGYREINMKGMKLVKDGGYLATCSCSHFMNQELFTQVISQAARAVHKRLRQVEFRTQAPDHPILWAADESYYLKFLIFQVVDEK